MKRKILITGMCLLLFGFSLVSCNQKGEISSSYSHSSYSKAEIEDSVSNDVSEISDDYVETESTQKTLSIDEVIAILTEKGNIWYDAGSDPKPGTALENYCIFINRGDNSVECESHIYGEVEIMYTLSFEKDSDDTLVMIYDGGSSYRSGTFHWTDDYYDALGSYSKWYIDEDSLAFQAYNLCKTDYE